MSDELVRVARPGVSDLVYPVVSLARLARSGEASTALDATRLAARQQARELPVHAKKAADALARLNPEPLAYDPELPDVVVCDLDGTLAVVTGRNPYAAQFCERDVVDHDVQAIAEGTGVPLVLVSGRRSEFRPQTERWLAANNVNYDALYMRPDSQPQESDVVVKIGLVDEYLRGRANVVLSLDDRDQVVHMWRALGVDCLQVAPGNF